MSRVPLAVLKSSILPFGGRLKRRPNRPIEAIIPITRVYDRTPDLHPVDRYVGCGFTYPPVIPRKYEIPVGAALGRGFNNSDYYMWYGSGSAVSGWSACRACLAICYDAEERKAHMTRYTCASYIWKALKLLARGEQCAVCNTKTKAFYHGVNLCSDPCKLRWQISETTTRENIEQALLLLGFKKEGIN